VLTGHGLVIDSTACCICACRAHAGRGEATLAANENWTRCTSPGLYRSDVPVLLLVFASLAGQADEADDGVLFSGYCTGKNWR
jgi:hypothetical protein